MAWMLNERYLMGFSPKYNKLWLKPNIYLLQNLQLKSRSNLNFQFGKMVYS